MLKVSSILQESAVRDRDLYAKILGLPEPWIVVDVALDVPESSVVVRLGRRADAPLECPECGRWCPGYDTQPRRWRHLDTCQFRTLVEAEVPRCSCPEHGIRQVGIPWAEAGSRFTALFERLTANAASNGASRSCVGPFPRRL